MRKKMTIITQITMITVLAVFIVGTIFSYLNDESAMASIFLVYLGISLILYYRYNSIDLHYWDWYRTEVKYYLFMFIFLLNSLIAIGYFNESNMFVALAFTAASILMGVAIILTVKKYKALSHNSYFFKDGKLNLREIYNHLNDSDIKVRKKKSNPNRSNGSLVLKLTDKHVLIKKVKNDIIIWGESIEDIKSAIKKIENQ